MGPKARALPYVFLLLPFDLIVIGSLLLTEVIGVFLRLLHPGANRLKVPSSPSATVQILNWEGRHLLEESIPAALAAVRHAGGDHELVVVDNGSTDGSADFVREHYPEVRIVRLDRNYRFTGGNNRAVRTSKKDIVVFLNNDMLVDRDFLPPLLEAFTDPTVFAVTSQVFFWDKTRRREETGKTRARYENGFFTMWHDQISEGEEQGPPIPVFWGGGGSCAFDRRKYLAIGGLDTLFDPFYVEDTDLSYQAWKRGWKCLLAPSSHVVHRHRATNKPKFGERFVDNTIRRNQYVFIWKNVTQPRMFLQHLIGLPRTHARLIVAGEAGFEVQAFLRALGKLPHACWGRLRSLGYYSVSDSEVLQIANANVAGSGESGDTTA
jgi:GT2 family glycosyltransferase